MTRVIEHCITLQSVNKVLKTRQDVIKYLSWRELDWRKGIMRSAAKKKLDPAVSGEERSRKNQEKVNGLISRS